jgi:translation initiation factor 3 subunit A
MRTVMTISSSSAAAASGSTGDSSSGQASVSSDEIVTPWMRFLWEAYRTSLDLLRNHSKLEPLYMEVANEALLFCQTHKRKNEFRRLSDILRTHLANVVKNQPSAAAAAVSQISAAGMSHQQYGINMFSGNTLQMHLEIRFKQLQAATDLELWQEAFRLVGDIHALFQGSVPSATGPGGFVNVASGNSSASSSSVVIVSPKRLTLLKDPFVMIATYYDKLSEIFSVSGNYLFHAAALMSLYTLVEMHFSELKSHFDIKKIAEKVVLATLAIPIISDATFQIHGELDEARKYRPLMGLLGLSTLVTRDSLLKDIQVKNILEHVSSNTRDIHFYLEVSFYPLTISKKMEPLMTCLHGSGDPAKYAEPLYDVILTRLLQQLGKVYQCMKLDNLFALAHVSPIFSLSPVKMEKFILFGCLRGVFAAQLDHRQGVIYFSSHSDVHAESAAASSHSKAASTSVVGRFNDFCRRMSSLGDLILSSGSAASAVAANAVVIATKEALGLERDALLERRKFIEKRKEQMEAEALEREKTLEKERQAQMQAEIEAEKLRLEEDLKKREMERMNRELKALEEEECRKMLSEIRKNREAQVGGRIQK